MAVRESYTDTTTNIRAVGDEIYNIDFQEAPLLQLFGFSSKNLNKFAVKSGWPSTKIEILEDTNTAFTTLLAESGFDDTETDMTVTTDTGQYFRAGDILGIYPTGTTTGVFQEKVLVTSVSGDVLTIVRGYGSTSGTAAANGTGIKLLTRANQENATYTTEYIGTPTAPYNYTQILDAAVEMSRTEMKMSRYGIDDHMDMQVAKLFDNSGMEGRLARLLHQTFYYGERVQRSGTLAAGTMGSMGGFNVFVDATTASANHVFDLSGAALNKSHIHKVLRAVRDSGHGRVTHLITGSWGMEKILSLYEDGVRTVEEQRVRGLPQLDSIRTPHGDVRLVYDYMCPDGEYYFVNADKIGWIPFSDFERQPVYEMGKGPYDGHAEKVVGEFTFMVANAKSHGRIYGASTTK